MLKKLFLLIAIASLFVACENNTDENEQAGDTTEISAVSEISLEDFMAKASGFVNKEVQVSGIVDHVCKKGGKKILLKSGDYSLHVFNDERYSEDLNGSEIVVRGIVEEDKIDEMSLTEEWNHAIDTHNSGSDADKEYLLKVEEYITTMKDSLKNAGVAYFSDYTLKYVSHKEKK